MTGRAAAPTDFTALPDLASRRLGGSVVAASDELFAEKENLIKPGAPVFAAAEFGPRGKVYDGWETRRRRGSGHDFAIIRLGVPGIVHGVVVDTSYFRGNYPAQVSVEAVAADGYPSPDELSGLRWQTLVGRSGASGDAANAYPVGDRRRWSHVRLSIYPDGGVARFRVHGQVVADPQFLAGTIDLAAMENGGRVVDCSDAFYASPAHLIMPGRAEVPADGWENARRRGPGNDYVVIALAGAGHIRQVEVDTSCFVGNAPGWVLLSAAGQRTESAGQEPGGGSGQGGDLTDRTAWHEVLPRTRLQPDTRHRFVVDGQETATHVRLDVIPDGGVARLRIHGELRPEALAGLRQRWLDSG